jgi:hypothetical protein
MLAKLPENERNEKINAIAEQELIKAQAKIDNDQSGVTTAGSTSSSGGNTKFYFNNSIAINQGIVDFKKTWGTRKLEDNWRRSQKSAADISNTLANNQVPINDPFKEITAPSASVNIDSLKKALIESIPLSEEMKKVSNEKIGSAMYDIGNYYREVTNDTLEAINTYEKLLQRFPEDPNKLAVYYNLYRLYKGANMPLSDKYKNILLDQFPESPFAKIILDPDYNQKNDEKEMAFNQFYNDVYELYTDKKYSDVLKSIEENSNKLGDEKIPAQLAYLNSLALGHLEKLDKLEDSFKNIVDSNPEDQLIVPLIKLQLAFIDSNRTEIANRPFALLDNETIINSVIEEPTNQEPVIKKPVIVEAVVEKAVVVEKPIVVAKPAQSEEKKAVEPVKIVVEDPKNTKPEELIVQEPKKEEPKSKIEPIDTFFELNEPGDYYFIVNVSDPTLNLSSSRFGIGQFNRVNFSGNSIKHQVKSIADQNQLIFVGPLNSKDAAQAYFDQINPLMKEIMKIPGSAYNTFLISDKNLEKITDLGTLERYLNFYKKNFNQ